MKPNTQTDSKDAVNKSKNLVTISLQEKTSRIFVSSARTLWNLRLAILIVLLIILTPKNLLDKSTKLPYLHHISSLSSLKLPVKKLKASGQKINQPLPEWAKSLPIPSRQAGKSEVEVVYNLKTPPKFKQSQELQVIVNDVVNLASKNNLSKSPLSITLIDAKTGEIAGYQQDIPRYPASVVKMFWMVALFAQIESGIWESEDSFTPYITKMIKESDNEAASFILDQFTDTKSSSQLNSEEFRAFRYKRQQINRFFKNANYRNINISQKTFPIDYLNLSEPQGSELQMLGNPIWDWNKITTKQAARLIYEVCYTGQAISQKVSQKMCEFLKRDLNPNIWQKYTFAFNPVQGFLGESLSNKNIRFYSKAGLTSLARGEAAMITTENDEKTYILAIFAQDTEYASNSQIFPRISSLVYQRMNARGGK